MSGFEARVNAAGPGDLSTLIALRALVDRVSGEGTVQRAAWLTGVREEYHRWYARHGDAGQPETFSGAETLRYLDEHIVGTLERDGVLHPLAHAQPAGEVPWTQVRLADWAAAEVRERRGQVLALLDGRIRGMLEAPAAPVNLPPAPADAPADGLEGVRPGRMLVPGGATLSARGLVKTYRKRRVVNEVDLQVSQGEIVGLLGPNGAGKTTSFYMMVGLIRPDRGKVFIGDRNLTGVPMYRRARAGIGYLAQEPSIFRKLTVEENVMAILQMMRIPRVERKKRLETLLDELSIKHLRTTRAYALSGGERRRLEITRALVGNPKFMLLDEPFAGVDPIAVHDIQQIVSDLRRRGIGVLISDHNVEQTLDIVDRAYIMYDGRVRVSGTVSELVWNEEVAEIYLGPTLTARMRERYANPADERSAAHDPRFGAGADADEGADAPGGWGEGDAFTPAPGGAAGWAEGTDPGGGGDTGGGRYRPVRGDAIDGPPPDPGREAAGTDPGGGGDTGGGRHHPGFDGWGDGDGYAVEGEGAAGSEGDGGAAGRGMHVPSGSAGAAAGGEHGGRAYGGEHERDGAGEQPDVSQDHTRNSREGDAV